MLSERIVEWTEQWKQDGLQQGLQPVSYTHLDVYKRQGAKAGAAYLANILHFVSGIGEKPATPWSNAF